MNVFFTSDTHFCHERVIDFVKRPFKDIEEMNDALVKNWNQRVKPEDSVFHLGDFVWGDKRFDEFMERLNGHIILVTGNHDRGNFGIITEALIEYGGHEWHLIHNSELTRHPYVLCGHVHNLWTVNRIFTEGQLVQTCVNVGVDVWGYRPITINEILTAVAKEEKKWKMKW